ncbi:TraM recognition domain-containing protein [Mucilaginibacter lacusdianchii]|uniref:TraM recognition domain-containing protein n=1 Tax=Mucilaginibacter lacusdianchii TaxID=2684211 RepID=UPI00131AED7C|nr:TraM recognition domain-containing protein [Mucilaginibacter sp. JXJ CY 39]
MEESKEQQSQHRFLQAAIYLSLTLELFCFIVGPHLFESQTYQGLAFFLNRLARLKIYQAPLYSKLFTLVLICLVSVGTLSKKQKDFNPRTSIAYPLLTGIVLFFGGLWYYGRHGMPVIYLFSWYDIGYSFTALIGTVFIHVAMDNVSKMISARLGKDRWNTEEESFMQRTKPLLRTSAVNIPTLFYFKKRVHKGYLVLENLYRGILLLGVPGSGKSFGVVMPVIRQMIANEFTLCVYDLKFPDLGKIAYYHYLLAKQNGKCKGYEFHVVNLNDPEKSRRINPFKRKYLRTLADASENAEALVEALKKGDKSGGSDQFFTQSAVNFLAACIFFFSKYEDGRYSTLPHVLAFLNMPYEDVFNTLFSEPELASLLSPFVTAYRAKAFEQLEGQVGTLKIFISRMATKETFWVFSSDDFDLKISDPKHPGILVLANDPSTQSINSACYSVVMNCILREINSKGNIPVGIVVDESPSLYCHRVDVCVSQARSNLVSVLLGMQELPMLRQQYGKETAETITSVMGNVLSGSVRNKDTLEWLERLFGKVKQTGESLSIDRNKTSLSLNEKLEPLIPAGKIASLKAGEMVGLLASDAVEKFTGKYETSAVNCRINLDLEAIKKEEKAYRDLPLFYDFKGRKEEVLRSNYLRITGEVQSLVHQFRPAEPEQPMPVTKASMRPTHQ